MAGTNTTQRTFCPTTNMIIQEQLVKKYQTVIIQEKKFLNIPTTTTNLK
jgi:hypothetical protein